MGIVGLGNDCLGPHWILLVGSRRLFQCIQDCNFGPGRNSNRLNCILLFVVHCCIGHYFVVQRRIQYRMLGLLDNFGNFDFGLKPVGPYFGTVGHHLHWTTDNFGSGNIVAVVVVGLPFFYSHLLQYILLHRNHS